MLVYRRNGDSPSQNRNSDYHYLNAAVSNILNNSMWKVKQAQAANVLLAVAHLRRGGRGESPCAAMAFKIPVEAKYFALEAITDVTSVSGSSGIMPFKHEAPTKSTMYRSPISFIGGSSRAGGTGKTNLIPTTCTEAQFSLALPADVVFNFFGTDGEATSS
jgi:hypothetical protein